MVGYTGLVDLSCWNAVVALIFQQMLLMKYHAANSHTKHGVVCLRRFSVCCPRVWMSAHIAVFGVVVLCQTSK